MQVMNAPLSAPTLSRLWERGRGRGWWAVAAGTVLSVGVSITTTAQAAVQLDRTRVIVSQKDNRQSIRATNRGKAPVLLQIWMEEGEAAKEQKEHAAKRNAGLTIADTVAAQTVPFIIDPPVVRLKPDETRALQVWLTQPPETLPKDRESQFWLNVLEVPAEEVMNSGAVAKEEADKQTGSRLEISILTQIKVFYRPEKLAEWQQADKDKLRFALEQDAQGRYWLNIQNPVPIHQSINKITLHQAGDKARVELKETPMIEPFEKTRIKLPEKRIQSGGLNLTVATLNDNGEAVETEHVLSLPI